MEPPRRRRDALGLSSNKLVTITVDTLGTSVYIYNPNYTTTAAAYPKVLPSTTANAC